MTHHTMWQDLHKAIQQHMKRPTKRLPLEALHEVQALMNAIESKHTGKVEERDNNG